MLGGWCGIVGFWDLEGWAEGIWLSVKTRNVWACLISREGFVSVCSASWDIGMMLQLIRTLREGLRVWMT